MVKNGAGTQKQSWSEAQAKTRTETNAVDNAKAFTFKLWQALPMALRDAGATELTENDFIGQGRAERSTPKLLNYLDRIRPHVSKLEAQLKPFFKGESPVSTLDSVRAALAAADQSQEVARTQAPDATTKLNEARASWCSTSRT